MTRYLLSLHRAEAGGPPRTDAQMREAGTAIQQVNDEMKAAGAMVAAGRLDVPARARVVRGKRQRAPVTDGPFIEAKEHLAGFYIIEATDVERALEWASRASDAVGAPIEVREFADLDIG